MNKSLSIRFLPAILAETLTSACAGEPRTEHAVADVDYTLTTFANDEALRFEVTVSAITADVCISREVWPREDGTWRGGDGVFDVHVGETLYATTPDDPLLGHCVSVGDNCVVRVKRGESVTGLLRYDVFGEPAAVATLESKALSFNPSIWFCRPQGQEARRWRNTITR